MDLLGLRSNPGQIRTLEIFFVLTLAGIAVLVVRLDLINTRNIVYLRIWTILMIERVNSEIYELSGRFSIFTNCCKIINVRNT